MSRHPGGGTYIPPDFVKKLLANLANHISLCNHRRIQKEKSWRKPTIGSIAYCKIYNNSQLSKPFTTIRNHWKEFKFIAQLWKLGPGIWNLQQSEVPRCLIISTVLQGSWPCYLLVCPAVHVFVKVLPYLLVMPRVPWNTHLQVGTKWHGKGWCFKTFRLAKMMWAGGSEDWMEAGRSIYFWLFVSASANPGEVLSVFIWHYVEAVRIPIPSFRARKCHYSVMINWYWYRSTWYSYSYHSLPVMLPEFLVISLPPVVSLNVVYPVFFLNFFICRHNWTLNANNIYIYSHKRFLSQTSSCHTLSSFFSLNGPVSPGTGDEGSGSVAFNNYCAHQPRTRDLFIAQRCTKNPKSLSSIFQNEVV